MSDSNGKSTLVKAVTNEGYLAFYRLVTMVASVLVLAFVTQINNSTKDLDKKLTELQYTSSREIGTERARIDVVDAKVGAVSLRVDAQARRIDNNDSDNRAVNMRINEIIMRNNNK